MSRDPEDGIDPAALVELTQRAGLNVTVKHGMSIDDLIGFLDREIPVICCIQAWGEPGDYGKRSSGHYIAAIGYDDDSIYFQDPVIEQERGFLSDSEFDERWYDRGSDGTEYDHFGIAMWLPDDDDLGQVEEPEQTSPVRQAREID